MARDHPRNTGPMQQRLRCGAKTRRGTECQAPAVSGKKRCRMHGGAHGSGAQPGNQNALKHGHYSSQSKAFRKHVAALVKSSTDLLDEF